MNEEAVAFGELGSLVGIVTHGAREDAQHARTAVIFLNPGIVHRVGAGRIYVKLARALAAMRFLSLRFDFSGIGDSPVRHDNLQFEKSAVAETRDAMDFLAKTAGIEDFILLGGCSGAKVAFDTACCDSRVLGALLINFPSVECDDSVENADPVLRGALFYYRRYALFNLRSWWRLVTGKSVYRQLVRSLWLEAKRRISPEKNISQNVTRFRLDLLRLVDRRAQLAFICSEGDPRLDDLRLAGGHELKRLCAKREVALDIIRHSDHTFSSLEDQKRLSSVLLERAATMVEGHKKPAEVPLFAGASRLLSQQLQP